MFRYYKTLGTGISGKVYLAQNISSGDVCAIKRVSKPMFSKRELDIWHTVSSHNNIVALWNVMYKANFTYFCMEPLTMSVKKYLSLQKNDLRQVERIYRQCLCGLQHCHDLNVIHRDVKPDNILLGANGVVKLCDFGLSRIKASSMTLDVVTLWYRSPELLFQCAHYNFSIDVWALTCVLIEMVYGEPPFVAKECTDQSQLDAILTILGMPNEHEKKLLSMHDSEDHHTRMDMCRLHTFFDTLPQFVSQVFSYDFHLRPTAQDLLSHCNDTFCTFEFKTERISFKVIRPDDPDAIFVF
jgi:serine/threonine protein kinase